MAKKLTNLKITKVSLVDEGACSAAHITLFKQKKGGSEMTFEEMMESLSEEQQAIIKAKFDAQNEELEKAKEECSEKEQELEEAKKAFSEKEEELEKVKQEKKDLETKASETEEEEDLAIEANSEDGVTKAKEELTEEEILKNVDPAVKEMIQKAKSEAEVHKQALIKMKEEKEEKEKIL